LRHSKGAFGLVVFLQKAEAIAFPAVPPTVNLVTHRVERVHSIKESSTDEVIAVRGRAAEKRNAPNISL